MAVNLRSSKRLSVRVNTDEKRLLKDAALASGMTITQFIMSTCLPRAKEIIRQEEQLVLSDADRDLFINALERPLKAPADLKKAAQDYLEQKRAMIESTNHGG